MGLMYRKFKEEVGINGTFNVLAGVAKSLTDKPKYSEWISTEEARELFLLPSTSKDSLESRNTASSGIEHRFKALRDSENAFVFFEELVKLSRISWVGLANPGTYLSFLKYKDESWFRSYKFGSWDHEVVKNDHWEFHIIPWHRYFHWFAECYIDVRLRPHLEFIFDMFDKWMDIHKPWMTIVTTGSNVAAVNFGYAFHSLLGIVYRGDEKYRQRYNKYYSKVIKTIQTAYDLSPVYNEEDIFVSMASVPHEGVLYGTYLLWSAVQFDKFQRKMNIKSPIFDTNEVRHLNNYLELSKTIDKGYHTSGDARPYEVMPRVKEYLDKLYPVEFKFDNTYFYWLHSKSKGEFICKYSNEEFEQVLFVIHANRSRPVYQTFHFGIKPGHFMLYSKSRGIEGQWVIRDAGYLNYFRNDNTQIEQDQYNTLADTKLLTRGRIDTLGSPLKSVRVKSRYPSLNRTIYINRFATDLIIIDRFNKTRKLYWNGINKLNQPITELEITEAPRTKTVRFKME